MVAIWTRKQGVGRQDGNLVKEKAVIPAIDIFPLARRRNRNLHYEFDGRYGLWMMYEMSSWSYIFRLAPVANILVHVLYLGRWRIPSDG